MTNTAEEWDNRHHAREVQPRWTRDDEAAFADEITIWTGRSKSNVKRISLLEQQIEAKIEHMKQLREWLLDDLNLKEARVSNRSADDVRIFTYATVIFLPLSFSSSIFSMGGVPSHSTGVAFFTAAIISLFATVLFVLNAGILMRTLSSWTTKVFDLPNEGFVTEHSESQWIGVGRTLNSWFVELPLKRVLMAWEVLAKPYRKQKGSRKKEAADDDKKGMKEIKSEPEESDNWSIVGVGLLLLPLFAVVYVIRFVFRNLYDLGKLILIVIPEYPAKRRRRKRALTREKSHESLMSSMGKDKRRHGDDGEAAKKRVNEGEKKVTRDEEKERLKADARAKEEKWQQYKLKYSMRQPRLDGISRHLAEGMTWAEAMEARKERKREIERELRDKLRKYVASKRRAERGSGPGTKGPGQSSEDSDSDSDASSSRTRSSSKRRWDKKSADTARVRFWAHAFRGAFPRRRRGTGTGTDRDTDRDPEAGVP